MIEAEKYDDVFFNEMEQGSLESARNTIPHIHQLFHPASVIDVGCGTGVWLLAWDAAGVKDYMGIEGPYVKPEMLKIDSSRVLFKDLKEPFKIGRKFDLAMSLEVGEHLPASHARDFVRELTQLSDVVIFSAAIPGQGGTFHINEQYPDYWAAIFREFGYTPVDCIRPAIWNNRSVAFWYRQNMLAFIRTSQLQSFPAIQEYLAATREDYLSRVHPDFFDLVNQHMNRTKSLTGFLNWKWFLFKKKYIKRK